MLLVPVGVADELLRLGELGEAGSPLGRRKMFSSASSNHITAVVRLEEP